MNIAFRVDASDQMGSGHFMRCIALADGLKNKGAQISFICRNLPVHLNNLLVARGIDCKALGGQSFQKGVDDLVHASWLGASQEYDARLTIQLLDKEIFDWIIVDHYALDWRWETMVRANCKMLMAIDDLADRRHDCNVLLDQNYYPNMVSRYANKVPLGCKLLIGPSYALLRDEFTVYREKVKLRTGEVRKILVFFGGVDINDYTSLVVQALAGLNCRLHVDVIIGGGHPNREKIEQDCLNYHYICHVQTTRIAELMAEADLAIGAGGSASWERCCLGLPALLVAIADNQIKIAKALHSINACVFIETNKKNSFKVIQKAIFEILSMPTKLSNISREAFMLVDGKGVSKVCNELGY